MAMATGGDERGMMSEINVTPFVDVMLVLLIIFMVTAPMLTTGVQVELPRVEAPPLPAPEEQMILGIKEGGRFFIGTQEITRAEMEGKLAAIVRNNPDQEVFLRADGKVPYEEVAWLMALCTKAGIPRMGMVTQPGADG